MFDMELTFLLMSSTAFFGTIDHLFPIFAPLFAPSKWTCADRAGFDGQVKLLSHGRHGALSTKGFGSAIHRVAYAIRIVAP
jgi:hypothetical protein